MNFENANWTREPEEYSIRPGCIEIVTMPHTDLWQRTYYHFRNDNAPVLQVETEDKFFSFIVKTDFTESHHRCKKPERFDMKYVVFEGGYKALSSEDLRDMLSVKAGGQDYDTWIRAFCERKYNSGFAREMARSVRRYLDEYRL